MPLVVSGLAAALLVLPMPASAATCSPQARVDRLTAFFDGWSRGDLSTMRYDPAVAPPPFGTILPKRRRPWPRELRRPVSRRPASVRAWLRRRVAVGDRVTLLRVFLEPKGSITGGTLSFRRTSPDVRRGHTLYGVAKFGVTCDGLQVFSSGRSWWTWTRPVSVCHPGKLMDGVRFCGRLP